MTRFLVALLLALGLAAAPAAAGTLTGEVVVAPDDEPGAGLWLVVHRLGGVLTRLGETPGDLEFAPRRVFSDAAGRFEMRDLPPGVYRVDLERARLPARFAWEQAGVQAVLVNQRDRAHTRLQVTTQAWLAGRARLASGGPAAGARVRVRAPGAERPLFEGEADDDGAFAVRDLEPGVRLEVRATSREGLSRRVFTTPLAAGSHPVTVELPSWEATPRRAVRLQVATPRGSDGSLVLEWSSVPPGADRGYETVVELDREGRAQFESPAGVFQAAVREVGARGPRWASARYYRVETDRGDPLVLRVTLEEVPSETAWRRDPPPSP